MSEKQKIINDVYFDRAGFGSKSRTLAEAREKDKTITMGDINEFFRKNVEHKKKTGRSKQFYRPSFRLRVSNGFVFYKRFG